VGASVKRQLASSAIEWLAFGGAVSNDQSRALPVLFLNGRLQATNTGNGALGSYFGPPDPSLKVFLFQSELSLDAAATGFANDNGILVWNTPSGPASFCITQQSQVFALLRVCP
jgi:hypothetical protein